MKKIYVFSFSLMCISLVLFGISSRSYKSIITDGNVEALASNPDAGDGFKVVTKYDIAKKLRITSISGQITGFWVNMVLDSQEELDSLQNKADKTGISFNTEPVDCHKRICVETIILQPINCPGDQKRFEMCHSQCDHSQNAI